jgi:hypothetical protein
LSFILIPLRWARPRELHEFLVYDIDGQPLLASKNLAHQLNVLVSQSNNAPALARPQIDCVFEHGERQAIPSDQYAKLAKAIIKIAIHLINVVAFDFFHVFQFKY